MLSVSGIGVYSFFVSRTNFYIIRLEEGVGLALEDFTRKNFGEEKCR